MNTSQNAARFRRTAWLVLLSFGFTYLFFYNGRQNINLVMTQMAEELGSTTTALGVVSSALFWCYAFGQLINGRLGAFFGYKRFMAVGVIGSAAINILISFQHSIPVIAVLWGLNGFFQSMVWSNGMGVVNKWWPREQRGFATGLATFFSGMAHLFDHPALSAYKSRVGLAGRLPLSDDTDALDPDRLLLLFSQRSPGRGL